MPRLLASQYHILSNKSRPNDVFFVDKTYFFQDFAMLSHIFHIIFLCPTVFDLNNDGFHMAMDQYL